MLLDCKRNLLEQHVCAEDRSLLFASIAMDNYDMFRTHPEHITILSQAMDIKGSNLRNLMSPTAPFNSINKHDCKVLATSSILVKCTTYCSYSDSNVSENYASLILKPKYLCRKFSLNVKPTALSRKGPNDGSKTPLINIVSQSLEIMGSISNQYPRFSESKTSEDEINNNNCAALVNSNNTTHHSKEDHDVAACTLLGLMCNCRSLNKPMNIDNSLRKPINLDYKLKCFFPSVRNQKNDSDYHVGTSRCNQLHHANETLNICRNKNSKKKKEMMIDLFASHYSTFE